MSWFSWRRFPVTPTGAAAVRYAFGYQLGLEISQAQTGINPPSRALPWRLLTLLLLPNLDFFCIALAAALRYITAGLLAES